MDATVVFLAVVAARFLLPLLIPTFPLPAVIGCLVLDAVDQTIFQSFGYDPPGYQSYDKAMDVFYLAVAYMSTMRNWTSVGAFRVSQALYFYRLVGVVAFEATQWRALLLVFPNTFEYFFIAYEAIRLRWDPARLSLRFWVVTAAAIWVLVKIPQEWWIHVAQLDFTDAVSDVAWFGPAVVAAVVLLLVVLLVFVRPRLAPPDRSARLAADPLPPEIDEPGDRHAWVAQHARVWSAVTVEKVVLVGLLSVVFAQLLPGLRSTNVELFVGLGGFVVINAAMSIWAARSGRSVDSLVIAFAVRVAVNFGLVLAAELLLHRGTGDLNADAALFFVGLLSLLTTMHDGFRPVFEVRAAHRTAGLSTAG